MPEYSSLKDTAVIKEIRMGKEATQISLVDR